MISSCYATKKPIDNSVAERQLEEHDSSLDVDICERTNTEETDKTPASLAPSQFESVP